jgi:putative MATE family efflux protein
METQAVQKNILGTEKIGKLLAKFAIPGIVSMVVNSLYNIVDQIFIGQGVGYLGNGATNVIFPMTIMSMAFALLLGDGAASYLSLMLGKRKEKEAAKGAAAGIVCIVGIGILLAAIYLIFMEPLCRLFGATESILPYALDYGRIIAIGLPFGSICCGFASIIRADGDPKFNMIGLLTGCVLNVIFDPVFIFLFHWGVKGAALATIMGQIANACLNLYYINRKMKSVTLNREVFQSCLGTMPEIAKLGVSSFISQLAVVFVIAVQNNVLVKYGAMSKYGADIPMTALGVTMKVFNILLSVIMGLSGGSQPILGYNYGSRQYDRVKKTFRYVVTISTVVLCIAFLIFQTMPMTIISIFGSDSDVYNEFAIKCLKIFLLMLPIGALQMTSGVFFQALGYPVQSSIVSLAKQIVFQIPAMLILSSIMGVEGALWAGPVGDSLSFLCTLILLLVYWKKIFAEQPTVQEIKEKDADMEVLPKIRTNEDKPLIITISRSYGAGGRAVGKTLASRLGISYYDTEVLTEAAHKSGIDKEYLEFADEKTASHLMMYSAVASAGIQSQELETLRKVAEQAQHEVIESIASQGSCVIVGRRADQILKNDHNLLRVFITMPLEERIQLVSGRDGLSQKEARRKIQRVDKERADYYNSVSDTGWGTPENYDICMDLGNIGTENAVNILLQMVQMRQK